MSSIYFAYGSNMDFNQLNERGILFEFLGKATLKNFVLKFNKVAFNKVGVGYANVVNQDDGVVEGLLFKIQNLEFLDKFEGYPIHYEKIKMRVHFGDVDIDAVVYVAQQVKTQDNLRPEKTYLKRLLTAKDYLSEEYFESLRLVPTID